LIGGIWEKLDVETGTKATSLPSVSVSSPEATGIVYPLVHVEWDQIAPFNNNLKDKGCSGTGNGKVWAGCVAVAVAQIMSRWEYPAKIGNYSFNWEELNKYKKASDFDKNASAKIQVANLMERIGSGVNMDYGCDGSYASNLSGPSFLLRNGFSLERNIYVVGTIATLIDYDSKKAIASMKREEPLIVMGCEKKINKTILWGLIRTSTSYDGCHMWVIDGYIPRGTPVTIGKTPTYFSDDYIHYNWGWGGGSNGYFKSGVFYSRTEHYNPDPKETKSYQKNNFQYKVLMTPYIRR